jgi:hypothetical protein
MPVGISPSWARGYDLLVWWESKMGRLGLLCIAVAVCWVTAAGAIGTKKQWDGVQREPGFGCVNATTTFGQVITIPRRKNVLNKFTFWWVRSTKGSMVVRGEVYAWDGSEATGDSLYESAPRTISLKGDSFHKESFAPAGLAVTPGAQYVIFASTDKDFLACARKVPSWRGAWWMTVPTPKAPLCS